MLLGRLASEPYFHWVGDGFEVDILLDGNVDAGDLEVGDSIITLPTGERYSALLITLDQISRIMDRHRQSGENLSGRYFGTPDLIVVRDKGVAAMVDVIRDIVASGHLPTWCPKIHANDQLDLLEM
ncbi:hypothetical protein AB0K18_35455 [Nonomuraea sp. NPDC049421]|uniref:hypothetical protein n=1 Tax=Nonomuraea sp. NPDC049421 TaxID=3155275 RepID=UPI00344A2831